jgi:hypothetical protein
MKVGIATQNEELRTKEARGSHDVQEGSAIRGKALRLNLLLPDRSAQRLENLKTLTEASSFTEVIRNALRLYEAVELEYEKGHKVQIVDKDGHPLGTLLE